MKEGNILNLVKHLVLELEPSGQINPVNARSHELLGHLPQDDDALFRRLFELDTPAQAFALAQSEEQHYSKLSIEKGPHLSLKWEFVPRQVEGKETLFCFAVEWEPLQELVEKIQRKNLMFKELLLNVLPHHVAESLIQNKAIRPKAYRTASILFTDVVSFSKLSFHLDPVSLIRKLNAYYSIYDDLVLDYGIEKIKTIGDAYMCVSGLPQKKASHAVDCCLVALRLVQETIKIENEPHLTDEGLDLNNWRLRVGIHSGPCISGVVGHQKYVFDIWGDSVNVAARMESASEPNQINISATTYEEVKAFFTCSYRGSQHVKNIGEVEMYFLDQIRPELSVDGLGEIPNDDFKALYCKTFRVKPTSPQLVIMPKMIQEYIAQQES